MQMKKISSLSNNIAWSMSAWLDQRMDYNTKYIFKEWCSSFSMAYNTLECKNNDYLSCTILQNSIFILQYFRQIANLQLFLNHV